MDASNEQECEAMRAAVYYGPNKVEIADVPDPRRG